MVRVFLGGRRRLFRLMDLKSTTKGSNFYMCSPEPCPNNLQILRDFTTTLYNVKTHHLGDFKNKR